ncbi:MAG: hypothetical protein WEC80_01030 [Patescibacteria group bacterium]
MKKELKVGFDLDGVILYNPARVARPILALFRKLFIHKPKSHFYIPQSSVEKLFWFLLHKTSFKPAYGYKRLINLVKNKKIKAYLITGRYSSLKSDFIDWTDKLDAKSVFTKVLYNKNNKQPHKFKEDMIKKYNLDVFVDDNWDIVQLLSEKKRKALTILWITNFLDQTILFPNKFRSLNQVIDYLEKKLKF